MRRGTRAVGAVAGEAACGASTAGAPGTGSRSRSSWKFVIATGFPPWRTSKSAAESPWTGRPSLPVTTTSTPRIETSAEAETRGASDAGWPGNRPAGRTVARTIRAARAGAATPRCCDPANRGPFEDGSMACPSTPDSYADGIPFSCRGRAPCASRAESRSRRPSCTPSSSSATVRASGTSRTASPAGPTSTSPRRGARRPARQAGSSATAATTSTSPTPRSSSAPSGPSGSPSTRWTGCGSPSSAPGSSTSGTTAPCRASTRPRRPRSSARTR